MVASLKSFSLPYTVNSPIGVIGLGRGAHLHGKCDPDPTGRPQSLVVLAEDPSRFDGDHHRKECVVGQLQGFLHHSDFPLVVVENHR